MHNVEMDLLAMTMGYIKNHLKSGYFEIKVALQT